MNGFSLLLALASLGVTYTWRAGVDQQQEYVLQIEPEIVQLLLTGGPRGDGEEIISEVPADVGPFQRLCITILPKDSVPARHTAVAEDQFRQLLVTAGRYASRDFSQPGSALPPTILWPGRVGSSPEQSYGVTANWQPDASGNQQYVVQIDPTVLRTMAIGDELHVPIEPTAGRLVRFVVKASHANLPRTGGAQTPLSNQPYSNSARNTNNWASAPDLIRQQSRVNNGFAEAPLTDGRTNQFQNQYPYGNTQNTGLQNPPVAYGNSTVPPYGFSTNNTPTYNTQSTANNNFEQFRPLTPGTDPIGGFVPQPVGNQQTQNSQRPRQFNPQYPDARVAGLPNSPLAGMTTPGLNPGMLTVGPNGQLQQDKPWGPLLFVTFALFFSIGGNLYLAYTALEFHGRYRSAIERLRSAARAA
jgi:hypothetical protein